MSPQAEEIHIPESMSLERRAVCSPRAEEPYLLRDGEGHVLATVEHWTPDSVN